jgi:hypothetical protein
MLNVIDIIYYYKPPWVGVQAHCRLRIYREGECSLVIWSELADNRGMSVTNYAGELATKIVEQYGLEPKQTMFVEHYPAAAYREVRREESYDLVVFDWQDVDTVFNPMLWTRIAGERVKQVASHPQWRRLAVEEVERLTGEER